MKKIKKIFKNIVVSTITIYSINLATSRLGIYIPINYFSLAFSSILGFPGLMAYIFLFLKYYR